MWVTWGWCTAVLHSLAFCSLSQHDRIVALVYGFLSPALSLLSPLLIATVVMRGNSSWNCIVDRWRLGCNLKSLQLSPIIYFISWAQIFKAVSQSFHILVCKNKQLLWYSFGKSNQNTACDTFKEKLQKLLLLFCVFKIQNWKIHSIWGFRFGGFFPQNQIHNTCNV